MTRERFLELMKERYFSPTEIGKATINTPTENKEEAKSKVQEEQQELVRAQENQEQLE